jgi:hypothetical protein
MRSAKGASLLLVWLAACNAAPDAHPLAPRAVVELARWQVFDGEQAVGIVRQLEIRDPTGPIGYYRVEDTHGRWLGHASDTLRFSRRVPFQDAEQDLGVWSMSQGVARLIDAKADVRLQPIAVEADARRER